MASTSASPPAKSMTVEAHGFRTNRAGHLELGGCDALDLAREFGTPQLVIDEHRFRSNCRAYQDSLSREYGNARALFGSKALCVVATCQIASQEGLGLDVASGGEIYTTLRAGVPAKDLYFHGNNKAPDEITYALKVGVGRFIVDNDHELDLLEQSTAELQTEAHILLRLTPGIEPHTHKAIQTGGVDSKFGFGIADGSARRAVVRASRIPRVHLHGIHSHIGSQVFDLEPFLLAAQTMVEFAGRMRDELDVTVEELNLGGGLGIRYLSTDSPPSISTYISALARAVKVATTSQRLSAPKLFVEPGRSLIGDAGVTLYTVGAIKPIPGIRTYVSVDGGMFENPRPALYGAQYEAIVASRPSADLAAPVAIAGRCCESGDVLIWEAYLPPVHSGDVLAMFATGAYTFSMASNYNRFPRPVIVLVGEGRARVAVERETYEDLVRKDVSL